MPNLLEAINAKLKEKGLVGEKWHELAAFQGALVQLYRNYYDGEHRLKLTNEMKKMMQITDDRLDRYNANYSETVVHAMSDRLKVSGIAVKSKANTSAALQDYLKGLGLSVDVKAIADTLQTQFGARDAGDAAQLWIDEIMQANRFDSLQIDVHIATLRDGSTYVMGAWEEGKGVVWAHEPAYDGDCGVLVVWDGKRQNLVAGVKIFRSGDKKLVNIYYPQTVEYYEVDGSEGVDEKLMERKEKAQTAKEGKIVGVPIIPFMNKSGDRKRPKSELVNVIPLQDSLNRGLVSLIMAEELTAFRVLLAKGIDISGGVTPGMVYKTIVNGENGQQLIPTDPEQAKAIADYYNSIDLKAIEGSPLVQFIEVADFLIGLIGAVSHTPLPQIMGSDSQSGESLKQREVGLLGKVGRAQVQIGNAWEDLAKLSARIQSAFGEKLAPQIVEAVTRWKDAQIRNDAEILTSADWYWSKGFLKESLRVMSQSSLANHTEKDIDRLLAERRADAAEDMTQKAPSVPGFEQFEPLIA
jgi:hypothetical protein